MRSIQSRQTMTIILPVPRNLQFQKQTICRLFQQNENCVVPGVIFIQRWNPGFLYQAAGVGIWKAKPGLLSNCSVVRVKKFGSYNYTCRNAEFEGLLVAKWPPGLSKLLLLPPLPPDLASVDRPTQYMLKVEDWMLFWVCWNSFLPSARIKATKEAVCWAVTVHSLVESRWQWTP